MGQGSGGDTEYQANDADNIVGELFSGGLTVAEAIERLRTRLLDLSSRNRLLNYRHPKGRSVQIVDRPNLNLVFERMMDGKSVPLKYVPEPEPDSYEGKRPEARLHATKLGIFTAFDFPPNPEKANGHRLHGIQTLFYPADLERQLRKIASEAKTAVEETGTNMLFLVFGFLEFYDSEDSEKAMLAPLLSLPATLVKGGIDRDTRTYQYTIGHSGEDVAENHTLREKLRRDFMLNLPEFDEADEPESYFAEIEKAVARKPRWKVQRQLTIGMLSFGKLSIWSDLDVKKNPGLVKSELVKSVFSGGSDGGGGLFAEDYRIDEHPEAAQSLIYNADSSQHSAIIDVLSGRNMVVIAPPGTGKSQTITNIIASAISKGKKVLFVSEKLAALEVVRRRLNQAGLGHFCLELHSHKTQKKRFLEDIQARMEQRFPAPAQYQSKMTTLQRQKNELERHATLLGSRIGNSLGLTVHEVFWAAERRRQELGETSAAVNAIGFSDATDWTLDDIERRRARLAAVAEVYDSMGGRFDQGHPWWGFHPEPLAPSDDEAIARVVAEAADHAREADEAANDLVGFFGLNEQPNADQAALFRDVLETIPEFPQGGDTTLLQGLFDHVSDPKGQRSSRLIADVAAGVDRARGLFHSAREVFSSDERLDPPSMESAWRTVVDRRLSEPLLSSDMVSAMLMAERLKRAAASLVGAVGSSRAPYGKAGKAETAAFLANYAATAELGLAQHPSGAVVDRSRAVRSTLDALSTALAKVSGIAFRRGLTFDGTPESAALLGAADGLPGLTPGTPVDAATLDEARRLAGLPLGDRPVESLRRIREMLDADVSACSDALQRCRESAERMGMPFDSTERAMAELSAMARVCASAPMDLLEYRKPAFGHARAAELMDRARKALQSEKSGRESLGALMFLDSLPPSLDIKPAVAALRRKDGFFALFDGEWRAAKRLHSGLCKEKRKLSARQRAEELSALAAWMDAREGFASDAEIRECFGGLFDGLATDIAKLERLNGWYVASRSVLAECPGMAERFDLTAARPERVAETAAKAQTIIADAELLAGLANRVRDTLGSDVAGFREARVSGWDDALKVLARASEGLAGVIGFFAGKADPALAPMDALRLMEARSELDSASGEVGFLARGAKTLRDAAGEELGRVSDSAGGPWDTALATISDHVSLVVAMATQARVFASPDMPLSTAETFARAKAELDDAWSKVSDLPAWDHFTAWEDLALSASSDAEEALRVLGTLRPLARTGASARDVFGAADREAEARVILTRFESSDEVRRVLGGVFAGTETDLGSLSATHAWGDAVCALNLPAPVCKRLFSNDATDAVNDAKLLYGSIADGCAGARAALESLSSYGSFSWEEWQRQARKGGLVDRPSEIRERLREVAGDPSTVLPWSKYLSLRQQARQEGLVDFVKALEAGKIPSSQLGQAFELSAYQSIGRSIYREHPELARFNGVAHDKTRSDYMALDAEIVELTGRSFASQIEKRAAPPEGQRGMTVGDYTDMHLLHREIGKQRRHIPIRQLVRRAGAALLELKPCFMMGPLSVAQYLAQGALKFDLVVMDEASQLRPEDAIGAIARGSQLVVVGDPKQLPPTNFFDRMMDSADDEDDDEAPASISGMESILDICQQLFTPVRSLRWHYRSHHESLIAFSNHHFYKNLIVFPSPYAKNKGLGVKYRHVRDGAYRDRRNLPEAQRVVDAVLEHMLKRPEESLGVVTLNQTQRELIEEILDKRLKTFSEGGDFMARWESEGWPFFVKNLENVQGDERDVIFISTTFGKVPGTDKVRQNFGPISRPDGWRRLNVLFTRSKRRVELFTSMTPEDIVVDERTPLGTKALRDYLDFAKRGVLVSTDESDREPDSDFEVSVANVVTSMGYEVKPQLGVAGFFIDMAVRNPDRPGEFLAGIECDGATYHSGFSVRDRDRIRQEILESLGWKGRIYRIWSTDWFYDPRRAVARLREFLEERRRLSAAEDPGDWVEEDIESDDPAEEVPGTVADVPEIIEADDSDDLFVEVGDRVTYCLVETPGERHNVLIVDSPSNTKMGLINEETPLALALLGLSPSDTGILEISGQPPRKIQVLKIQRQEALLS